MSHPFDELSLADLRRRRSVKWQLYPADVLPLWVAEMDYALAEPIRAALAELVDRGDTGYAHPGRLAEAFAEFAQRRWALAVDPTHTRIVGDVMQGVRALLQAFTPPGAGVVINTPAYPPFFHHITDAGRRVVEVPLALDGEGRYGFDLDALEAAFAAGARAYLLNNPHNPTGRVFTEAELESVATLADRYDVLILADEVHAPLVYPGHRHVPLGSIDAVAARRGFTLTAASKGWNLAGLKTALIVAADPDTAKRLRELPDEVSFGASLFGVVAGEAAFREGAPWLDDTIGYLDGNRRVLADLLAEHLPGVRYRPPEGTYLGWLDCRPLELGDNPGGRFLKYGRVAFSRGSDFGAPGVGHVRFNFATSRALVEEGVRRMAAAVASERDLRP